MENDNKIWGSIQILQAWKCIIADIQWFCIKNYYKSSVSPTSYEQIKTNLKPSKNLELMCEYMMLLQIYPQAKKNLFFLLLSYISTSSQFWRLPFELDLIDQKKIIIF
jgi:hypothetical protein